MGLVVACLLFCPRLSPAVTSNDVDRAVQNLGAPDHKTREAASRFLSDAGTAAVSALEKAAHDPDPEIRLRATELLPLARLGLPAGIPPDLRGLAAEYIRASPEEKHEIIQQLGKAGPAARPILIALATSEPDFETRVGVFEPVLNPIMTHLEATLLPPQGVSKEQVLATLTDLEFYQAMMPEDPQLPLNAIRRLDGFGLKAQANTVFERAFQQESRICSDHPHDPESHNNLAWLCAVSRRRLDEGLQSIQLALAETPDDPALLDTKAELLFQKGQRDAALDLIAKCIKASPELPYFRQQQTRIRSGDPSVPPPEADTQ
jgi:hypothetical protein